MSGKRIKLPKAELERAWQAYEKRGDVEARNTLINAYLPLVDDHARRLGARLPAAVDVEDLKQAGVFGLIDAIDGFDRGRNIQFQTYCSFRIRGAMIDELRRMDWVPRLTRKRSAAVRQVQQRVFMAEGRMPGEAQVAAELGVDADEYRQMARDAEPRGRRSLEATTRQDAEGRGARRVDLIADGSQPDPVLTAARHELVTLVAQSLKPSEQSVLEHYYFDGLTMKQIGRRLGLAESRISQIHSAILKRARLRPELRNADRAA